MKVHKSPGAETEAGEEKTLERGRKRRRHGETEGNKERGGMSEEKKYTSEETGRK